MKSRRETLAVSAFSELRLSVVIVAYASGLLATIVGLGNTHRGSSQAWAARNAAKSGCPGCSSRRS